MKNGGLANLIVTHEDDSYSEIKTLNGREVAADLTSLPHSPSQDINQSEMTDNKLLSLSLIINTIDSKLSVKQYF